MTSSERRRPGGARPDGPLLERDQIIAAGMKLTAELGLDGMSMRKLGDELGVTSMAIYWYFKSKDELVQAITDAVLAKIDLPDPEDKPWDERLRMVAWEVHDVLVDYPGISEQLLTYQNFPPAAVPLLEAGVATLRDAGFDELKAATAFNVLSSYVISRAHFDAYQRLVWNDRARSSAPTERVLQGWQKLVESLDDTRVENARSYVAHLLPSGANTLVFEHGLDLLLQGLRSELEGA